jgi:hypothetical protein
MNFSAQFIERRNPTMKKFITAFLGVGLWGVLGAVPAQSAGIGLVTGVRGQATVRHERGAQEQALKFKDDLFWQDTLSTGTDAQLRLLIMQKSVITMKELTQLQLREDLVSPNQPKKKSVVDLVSGAVRVVVDKESLKDGDYEVRTNMAVAAIRGSDLYGQTGADRVEFCAGPGSSVTAIHNNPGIGRRELQNLQCASVTPNAIDVRNITLNEYRTLSNIGPTGSQTTGHGGTVETRTAPPPGGGGGPGGGTKGGGTSNNLYGINNAGCLLCKVKTDTGVPSPIPGPDSPRRR